MVPERDWAAEQLGNNAVWGRERVRLDLCVGWIPQAQSPQLDPRNRCQQLGRLQGWSHYPRNPSQRLDQQSASWILNQHRQPPSRPRGPAGTTMGLEMSSWAPGAQSWPAAQSHRGLLIPQKHDLSLYTTEVFGFHSWQSGRLSLYVFFLWKFHSITKARHAACKIFRPYK